MSPLHPGPGELIDAASGELRGAARERVDRHLEGCPRCRATAVGLAWLERTLAAAPEESPPSGGLARLLDEVERTPQASRRGQGWAAPVAASLAGVAAGAGLIWAAGVWLMGSPLLGGIPLPEPLGAAPGFGLAAVAFFGIGSFATLALAPVLLLESRWSRPARR